MTRSQWRAFAARVAALAQEGRKIDAIKMLRAETDCGLRDAFHAVDRLRAVFYYPERRP